MKRKLALFKCSCQAVTHVTNRKELQRGRDNKDFKLQRVWDVEVIKEKGLF